MTSVVFAMAMAVVALDVIFQLLVTTIHWRLWVMVRVCSRVHLPTATLTAAETVLCTTVPVLVAARQSMTIAVSVGAMVVHATGFAISPTTHARCAEAMGHHVCAPAQIVKSAVIRWGLIVRIFVVALNTLMFVASVGAMALFVLAAWIHLPAIFVLVVTFPLATADMLVLTKTVPRIAWLALLTVLAFVVDLIRMTLVGFAVGTELFVLQLTLPAHQIASMTTETHTVTVHRAVRPVFVTAATALISMNVHRSVPTIMTMSMPPVQPAVRQVLAARLTPACATHQFAKRVGSTVMATVTAALLWTAVMSVEGMGRHARVVCKRMHATTVPRQSLTMGAASATLT